MSIRRTRGKRQPKRRTRVEATAVSKNGDFFLFSFIAAVHWIITWGRYGPTGGLCWPAACISACLSRLQRPTTAKQSGQGSLLIQIPQSMPLTPSGGPPPISMEPRYIILAAAFRRRRMSARPPTSACHHHHATRTTTRVVSAPGPQTKTSRGLFRSLMSTKPCDKTEEVRWLHCGPPEDLSTMCPDRSHSGPIDQRQDDRERTTHPPIRFRLGSLGATSPFRRQRPTLSPTSRAGHLV